MVHGALKFSGKYCTFTCMCKCAVGVVVSSVKYGAVRCHDLVVALHLLLHEVIDLQHN